MCIAMSTKKINWINFIKDRSINFDTIINANIPINRKSIINILFFITRPD